MMGQWSQTQQQVKNEVKYTPPAGKKLSPGITRVIEKVQTILSTLNYCQNSSWSL
jgi:hypothetical protein